MDALADTVDLFVHLGTVMVTLLTSASNCVLDSGRMPRADTRNLPKTLVRLTRKFTSMPTRSHT